MKYVIFAVTPLAGVWIEIAPKAEGGRRKMSLPSRECGLKLLTDVCIYRPTLSLPSRECGLKCPKVPDGTRDRTGHSPRGSVD